MTHYYNTETHGGLSNLPRFTQVENARIMIQIQEFWFENEMLYTISIFLDLAFWGLNLFSQSNTV